MPDSICGLIPVYNNHMTIEKVIAELRQYIEQVIVIDDGSDDGTESILNRLASENPNQIHIKRLTHNQGKGAAVQAGLQLAKAKGFSHALQVDADGQHNLGDIPEFLSASKQNPTAMILGAPIFADDIPAIRKHGRKLTQLMIALEAGSFQLPDAMCGFRVYPVLSTCKLGAMSSRMSFDPEVMIRGFWAGIPFIKLPTKVRYLSAEEGGVSHFRMVHDNLLHVRTHTRLILQAPYRWFQTWIR